MLISLDALNMVAQNFTFFLNCLLQVKIFVSFRFLSKDNAMNLYCVRSSTSICTQTTPDVSSVGSQTITLGPDPETVTQDTFMDEVKTYMTYKVAKFIGIHWFPLLVPIGLVGNTLSFLVMIKPNNRKMSTCNYMAAISVNDNIMMVLTLNVYLITEIKVHIMTQNECKFLAYLHLLFLQNSTFQVFAMTVDKFIAIYSSLQHSQKSENNCNWDISVCSCFQHSSSV